MAAKPCASVSWMSRARRLRSSSIGLASRFELAAIGLPALMQREGRLPRDRFEQRHAPLALAVAVLPSPAPPIRASVGEHQRRDRDRMIRLAVEHTHRLRQACIVAGVFDRLAPAGGVCQTGATPWRRAAAIAAPSPSVPREQPSEVRHPQVAAPASSSISHTPHAWLSQSSASVFVKLPKKPSMSRSRRGGRAPAARRRSECSPCTPHADARRVQSRVPRAASRGPPRSNDRSFRTATDRLACPNYGARFRGAAVGHTVDTRLRQRSQIGVARTARMRLPLPCDLRLRHLPDCLWVTRSAML